MNRLSLVQMSPFLERPHFPMRQLLFLVDWVGRSFLYSAVRGMRRYVWQVEGIEERIQRATHSEILPKLSYTPNWYRNRIACEWLAVTRGAMRGQG